MCGIAGFFGANGSRNGHDHSATVCAMRNTSPGNLGAKAYRNRRRLQGPKRWDMPISRAAPPG